MAKNQFQMHILWFLFHTDVKCRKMSMEPLKYKNVLFFDHRVRNVPQVSLETSLTCWLKTSQALRSVENKVESLERQCFSEKLSFVHKKETEHSFELSLSICVFYLRIFNLEMQNFSLENHHMMNARQPFCWWMTFTKVSNPVLPSPPKWLTWPLDVCGGLGYGWFYWFSLRIFSPTTSLELEIFSSRYNGVSFFQHYTSWATFFNAGCFFPRNIFACFFPPEISLQDIFFLESPITPQKSNSRPLKSTKHLLSWQILICQSFLKAFETIGD